MCGPAPCGPVSTRSPSPARIQPAARTASGPPGAPSRSSSAASVPAGETRGAPGAAQAGALRNAPGAPRSGADGDPRSEAQSERVRRQRLGLRRRSASFRRRQTQFKTAPRHDFTIGRASQAAQPTWAVVGVKQEVGDIPGAGSVACPQPAHHPASASLSLGALTPRQSDLTRDYYIAAWKPGRGVSGGPAEYNSQL